MQKFILLLHENIEQSEKLSTSQMEELVAEHMAWAKSLENRGMLRGGDGLDYSGKLIQGKECIINDGPYIETKEMIGGYYLIEAKDMEEAVNIAKECPCHLWGGTTEVRPIMNYE